MEYLYVPTTTLNFNNILSTGSISPASFYPARSFGYKRFSLVEPNPFQNILLVYNQYPEFDIDDSERDNYPLILRLRSDKIHNNLEKVSSRGNLNIYACNETIYFDMASAEFFFTSQDAQRITRTKAESSLTTKLVELFEPYMSVAKFGEKDSIKWNQSLIEEIKDYDITTIIQGCEVDNRINRLKGFATGYVLGAYKSIDPKLALVRSQVRSLRNEISARLSDPSRNYPDSLRNEVEFSCRTLESFFTEEDMGIRRFSPDNGDSIQIDQLKIADIRDRNALNSRLIRPFIDLVNNYSFVSKFTSQLEEQRLDVAIEGAQVIKSIIGSKWDGSSYQQYINALLNNIKSGNNFDFNNAPSLLMQSFAAFILKGDDLEKLESFLIANRVGDFRFPFAIWGAMFGYSKIPKTLYVLPIQQGDVAYLCRIHSYVHSIVHGIRMPEFHLPTVVPPKANAKATTLSGEASMDLIRELEEAIPKSKPWHSKISQLLLDKGGLCKTFISQLRAAKTADLGMKRISGVSKQKVVNFFEVKLEQSQQMPTFNFSNPSRAVKKVFVQDSGAWDVIVQVIPFPYREEIKKDLVWFQGEFANPNSRWYGSKSEKSKSPVKEIPEEKRTNQDAIDAFCRSKPLRDKLSEQEIEVIRQKLLKAYL